MDEEKKRRAIKDLREYYYEFVGMTSTSAVRTVTLFCLGKMTKQEMLNISIGIDTSTQVGQINRRNKIFLEDEECKWFVRRYIKELRAESYQNNDASREHMYMTDGLEPPEKLPDIKIPIKDIYWLLKKINRLYVFNYGKKCLYKPDHTWESSKLRTAFIKSIEYRQDRGRKKSKKYTVSRDDDRLAYYVSTKGRLAKLPRYKYKKYIKQGKIVEDHNEYRAIEEITDGQYVKVGSYIQKHMPRLPQSTKDALQRAFEEIKPCQLIIDRDFKKAYDPIYNNHQDTDGDKASNYSCMSGCGNNAQEFYGGIHGCSVVRFETKDGEQVGRCIMYEYKGQRHFIRIYGIYEYHRTMINLLQNEMHENDLFGRNIRIDGLELETDWTGDTHTMYLDGNYYGCRKEYEEGELKYIVTDHNYDNGLKQTGGDTLEYMEDGPICEHCGYRGDPDDGYWINDNYYCCWDCAEEEGWCECYHCGEYVQRVDMIHTEDGYHYCNEYCAEKAGYRKCKNCGEWHGEDEMIEVAPDEWYCDGECAENDGWYKCDYCDDWVHENSAEFIEDKIYCCVECAEKDGWERKDGEWKRVEDEEEVKEQEPEQPKELSNEG